MANLFRTLLGNWRLVRSFYCAAQPLRCRLLVGSGMRPTLSRGKSGSDMMAAAILVISSVMLLMFLVTYCRSLMAGSARYSLSREVRDVAGISLLGTPGDFDRIMRLLRLSGNRAGTSVSVRAIALYHRILILLERTFVRLLPELRSWAQHERTGCTHFVAVVLDRQIRLVLDIRE